MAQFTINKSDVLQELERESSLAVRNLTDQNGNVIYDPVFADGESAAMLDGAYNEARNELAQQCREFVSVAPLSTDSGSFVVTSDHIYQGMSNDFVNYLVDSMMVEWQNSSAIKLAYDFSARKAKTMERILRMLYYKPMPQ